ncbi:hypothetical protein [Limnoglobus roseus]|uniref:Uncharacterized protein n=1 Tax=Limnoglobus roseus TaxID=2598579 RepID=A0A5C1AL60_9BACT|nr:hypothetical protein [Limnoglobus roseus]QEL18696.1 hypothetical protein PX52LOC_05732 [Limnoglobus roseus]
MTPWWKIVIVLGWTLASFTTGWHVKGKYVQAAQLEDYQKQVAAAQTAQQEANDRAVDLEKQLATERQLAHDINSKTEQTIEKHPEFTSCKLPDGSVQLLNDAIAGRTASGFNAGM